MRLVEKMTSVVVNVLKCIMEVKKNEGQNVPLPMLFKVVYVVQK